MWNHKRKKKSLKQTEQRRRQIHSLFALKLNLIFKLNSFRISQTNRGSDVFNSESLLTTLQLSFIHRGIKTDSFRTIKGRRLGKKRNFLLFKKGWFPKNISITGGKQSEKSSLERNSSRILVYLCCITCNFCLLTLWQKLNWQKSKLEKWMSSWIFEYPQSFFKRVFFRANLIAGTKIFPSNM